MRKFMLALALSLSVSTSVSAAAEGGEIGYPRGSLGYEAIMRGDIGTAELQIETADGVAARDPARMLNLGYVYLRTGRVAAAQQMFEAVRDSRRHFAVELANGSVADSREVARRALASMQSSIALR